jgi:spore germination protein YaaH
MVKPWVIAVSLSLLGLLLGIKLVTPTISFLSSHPIKILQPLAEAVGVKEHRVIGFMPYWTASKADRDYSPYLTTLTYFGLIINADGTIQEQSNPGENEPGFNFMKSKTFATRLSAATSSGMNLSLLLHQTDTDTILNLISDPNHGVKLVDTVEPYFKQFHFTDLNLDFESFVEASPSARQQFTHFVTAVKRELKTRNMGTLTLDISPSALVKPYLYDPEALGHIADYLVIMAYDYHYTGSYVTGPIAPLYGATVNREFDVAQGIQAAERVIPRQKLILGIPLYGYEWESIRHDATAAVIPGSGRSATYNQIADKLIQTATISAFFDPVSQENSLLFPDPIDPTFHILFYGNDNHLPLKLNLVDRWGGIALWALGFESQNLSSYIKDYKYQTITLP